MVRKVEEISLRTNLLTPGVPCIARLPSSCTDRSSERSGRLGGSATARSFGLISPRRNGGATLLYPDAPVESKFCSAQQADPRIQDILGDAIHIHVDQVYQPDNVKADDVVSYPGSHKDPAVNAMKAQKWRTDLGRFLQRKYKDLNEAFREIDVNKDHSIDEREMIALFNKLHLPPKDAKALFRHMDKDGAGSINFAQFQEEFGNCVAGSYVPAKNPWHTESSNLGGLVDDRIYLKEPHLLHGGQRQSKTTHVHGEYRPPKGGANSDPYASLQKLEGLEAKVQTQYATVLKAFRQIDEDKSGKLSRDELRTLFTKFNLPYAALETVFDHIDVDESSEITFAEFQKHFGPIIQPCVGTAITNFHHVNDYGTRFSPVSNRYEDISSKQAPSHLREPDLPWMKKEDPNWIQRVQMGSSRGLRSGPPPRGSAPHPDRSKYKEREKTLPKLPERECTWAGPDAKKYHPDILEAAPTFTYQGRGLWDPYTRKQTLLDYSKRQEDQNLEYICERRLHHGRMVHGEHGKNISEPIAGWT